MYISPQILKIFNNIVMNVQDFVGIMESLFDKQGSQTTLTGDRLGYRRSSVLNIFIVFKYD